MLIPHQAKQPTRATNLSKSAAPAQLITVQAITMRNLNPFFCHLTRGSAFPLRVNRPFSRILTAGKNWRGTESRIARAYINWTYLDWIRHKSWKLELFLIKRTDCTILFLVSRLTRMTVCTSDPKAKYASIPAPPNRTVNSFSVDAQFGKITMKRIHTCQESYDTC